MESADAVRTVRELILELHACSEYILVDALYYWALCWGSSGAEQSFLLKYGSLEPYHRALQMLQSRVREASQTDLFSAIVSIVESLSLRPLAEDVQKRVESLSAGSRMLAKLIRRLGLHEQLCYSCGGVLEASSLLNMLARSLAGSVYTARLLVMELIRAGLLVACCWAPYEGFPHLYLVPKYSRFVWRQL